MLRTTFTYRTACCYYHEIACKLLRNPLDSLQTIKKALEPPGSFYKLVEKVRKIDMNPIPQETVAGEEFCSNVKRLRNPYHLVQLQK